MFHEEIDLFAPSLLFTEIENNKEEIYLKSGLTTLKALRFIGILKRRIRIIQEEEFSAYRAKAEQICPDEKDVPYFALAFYLNCPVWSNEKKFKEQQQIIVYATHELLEIFGLIKD